ncbi:MAG: helix-turn-helix domain-containing protein [Blautia sp.]|nr:helix-turn-helix domain-containing protein [Blautia sp.]
MTRNELIESFAMNMEKERMDLDYSQVQMAKALDVSISTYKRILNGESTKIDLYMMYRMYLLTNKLGCGLGSVNDPYLDIFDKLRHLSEQQLRFIRSIVNFELDFTKDLHDDELAEDYITVLVPTGHMQDGMVYDSCDLEKMNIAPYRKRYGNVIDCGLRITGSSLHPVYQMNDTLLISCQPVRDGDTGIFIDTVTGLVYVRKLYQGTPCRLEPLNHYGRTFYIDRSSEEDINRWIYFGYVVTRMHD